VGEAGYAEKFMEKLSLECRVEKVGVTDSESGDDGSGEITWGNNVETTPC